MELELVTIGNELLLGLTLDTNAVEFATTLTEAGVRLVRTTTVTDDGPAIRDAVFGALKRTGFVVTTGGLGPTRDDVTKKVVADIFDAPLELDSEYLEKLRERFARWGRGPMPETNRTQAEVPRGAVQLENRRGTAPGLWLEGPLGVVVMLPGVPQEMNGLLHEELMPRLRERMDGDAARVTRSKMLRTTGVSESALADKLHGVDERLAPAPVTLAYLPSPHGTDLRLTAWNVPVSEADVWLERSASVVRPLLGSWLYAEGDTDLAEVVLNGLQRAGRTLAVAESCTGGLVGERLTAIAGASAVFVGGVVAYDNAVKEAVLGVPHELLETVGAVSEEVAEAMLDGVATRFGADAAVAVTGVAGPSGGTPEKPVGTVCLAARVGEARKVTTFRVPGDRDGVRQRSAQAALNLVRGLIS
jgi:nicotinamide-nucleotide amidase